MGSRLRHPPPRGEVLVVVLISAHADGSGGNPALLCVWKVRSDANQENRIGAGGGHISDVPVELHIACGTQRHWATSQDRLVVCAGVANQCAFNLIDGSGGAGVISTVYYQSFHFK